MIRHSIFNRYDYHSETRARDIDLYGANQEVYKVCHNILTRGLWKPSKAFIFVFWNFDVVIFRRGWQNNFDLDWKLPKLRFHNRLMSRCCKECLQSATMNQSHLWKLHQVWPKQIHLFPFKNGIKLYKLFKGFSGHVFFEYLMEYFEYSRYFKSAIFLYASLIFKKRLVSRTADI